MLDIDLIREHPAWVRTQLRHLNDEAAIEHVDAVLALDAQRRDHITKGQAYKEARNIFSKGAGRLRGNKDLDDTAKAAAALAVTDALQNDDLEGAKALLENPASAPPRSDAQPQSAFDALFAQLKTLGDAISAIDEQIRDIETQLQQHMLWIPNMPHSSTPVAASEVDNIAHPVQGQQRTFDFTPQPHWDLGPALGIIDFERGVKLSGSRFYILKHNGARLYRALINFFIDQHTARGYQELYVPFVVREEPLYGSGQFPKFKDVVYFDHDAGLYMLPTSEVAMANMFGDEILEESALTLNLVAHTPCFRRERMSAGRDVRGIKRVHQFEKVELFKITHPDASYDEMEVLMQNAESVIQALDIPYRRLEIVTGDLGFTATKKFDLEMYAPGSEEWLEVSSVSNTEAFQARRANVRFRPSDGGKPQYVHMLNGSGLGMTRTLIAVMENYQQADGSIRVPEVLVPYMGGIDVIEPGA